MPAAPSEPEKYSIDEMMDRLKSKPDGDPNSEGELVTRADGSQAIRIRKRKRRSSQPHKEKAASVQRARVVQLSAALVLLMLGALVAGGAFIYTNSSLFRENVLARIAEASGAKVEVRQFRMSPARANANGMSFTWPEGNVLKTLDLKDLKARVHPASIFGSALTGEEVVAGEGILMLGLPVEGQALRFEPGSDGVLPVKFNRIGVNRLNLTLGDKPESRIRLLQSEGSFYSSNTDGRAELRLHRGELAIDGWAPLTLDRAFIEFRGKETDIVSMRFFSGKDDSGVFSLSGIIAPYSAGKESVLDAQLESFQLGGITGPAMGKFFIGKIDTLPNVENNALRFHGADFESGALSLSFQSSLSSPFHISGFPFLHGLAVALDDKWFETPVFEQDSTGIIEREGGTVWIRELHTENKGRLSIRGEVQMDRNQKLSGELQVGVASAMIASASSPRLNGIFSEENGGFRWITLKLGGTSASPDDNFAQIFKSTGNTSSEGSPDTPRTSFEELTRPR